MSVQPAPADTLAAAHRRIGLRCAGVVAVMVALAFASVPLYRLFCQTTGYNGTTQRASAPSEQILDRRVSMRFDANTARDLGWSFEPVERTGSVRVGETKLAFYRATNTSDRPITGTAVFNVLPEGAGIHFNKLECFCFKEQTLAPGQSVEMPVSFFVDPAIARDAGVSQIATIVLSYTFFPVDNPKGAAGAKSADKAAATGKGS